MTDFQALQAAKHVVTAAIMDKTSQARTIEQENRRSTSRSDALLAEVEQLERLFSHLHIMTASGQEHERLRAKGFDPEEN